jgi:acetylornithine deacetylase/succinyl-diaminopimelate desuccinylase-like protein
VSVPGRIDPPLLDAFEMTSRLFAECGVEVSRLDLPGTAPVVTGHIPAPPGAPSVLLYSHYDVVPAGDEADWTSPPFEPTERDGAIVARGAADTKSNVLAHVGRLRAWGGRPPVGIKLCIEGHEEIGSGALPSYPATDPERFQADALLIGDMGSLRPGVPTLTTALRGMANVALEVRTLRSGKHSGQYGGAAPDALLALLRAIASLHDEHGDVAVAGLRRTEWEGRAQPEADFRELGTVLDGMPLIGTGGLGSRVWSGPAITVIGIDAPSVEGAVNAVSPYARAVLNVRVHPEQDAVEAQEAVMEHLRAATPFGIALDVQPGPDRQRVRGDRHRSRLRCGPGRLVGRVGRGGHARRERRLDPDRQRARARPAGRRGAAGRHDGRLREHPRAGRAGAAQRVRARDGRRGRLPRALRGRGRRAAVTATARPAEAGHAAGTGGFGEEQGGLGQRMLAFIERAGKVEGEIRRGEEAPPSGPRVRRLVAWFVVTAVSIYLLHRRGTRAREAA